MSRIIIIWTLCICSGFLFGQSEAYPLIAKKKSNEVVLRWAPSNAAYWLQLQRAQIWVERADIDPVSESVVSTQRLVSDTFQVWQESAFRQMENWGEEEDLVALAGYLMHAPYESLKDSLSTSWSDLLTRREELSDRYSMALLAADRSVQAAKALGMRWTDPEPKLDLLQVYALYVQVDSMIYHSIIAVEPGIEIPFRPEIQKTNEQEDFVVLSWDRRLHSRYFTSYWVEKSKDQEQWERLNEQPYIHAKQEDQDLASGQITYIDSASIGDPYYYRIIGMDAFGETSEPSEAVRLSGRDRTPPAPPQKLHAAMTNESQMVVSWEALDNEPGVQYAVRKSNRSDGIYRRVSPWLTASTLSWTDTSPSLVLSNYYEVCIQDTAENISCSRPVYGIVQDTFPPAAPEGLEATVDSMGVVRLKWNLGREEDLKGYHVYFANAYDRVFSILTGTTVQDTQYTDTISLNSLTKSVFYRVVAEDIRSNRSEFSSMIRVERPDTIPPSAAVFKAYEIKDESILLRWANSSSADVIQQLLFRKDSRENEFTLLDSLAPSITSYMDQKVMPGKRYVYRLITVDQGGWTTPSPVDLSVYSKAKEAELSISAREEAGTYSIQFQVPADLSKEDRLKLYRAVDTQPFLSWKTVRPEEELQSVKIEKSTRLKALIIHADGRKSNWSNILELKPIE
jgi:fibronectin type 3 domain-containing protein